MRSRKGVSSYWSQELLYSGGDDLMPQSSERKNSSIPLWKGGFSRAC